MKSEDVESRFEDFRRDRLRRRAQATGPVRDLGSHSKMLEELEEVEESAMRDERISVDVHEFFAEVTRNAALIVSRIAERHEEEHASALQNEIRDFLSDVIRRTETLVASILPHPLKQELMANLQNIIATQMEEFRAAGAAGLKQDAGAMVQEIEVGAADTSEKTGAETDEVADEGGDEASPRPLSREQVEKDRHERQEHERRAREAMAEVERTRAETARAEQAKAPSTEGLETLFDDDELPEPQDPPAAS